MQTQKEIRRLVRCGVLSAMCAVLGMFFSVEILPGMKLTLEAFPIYLAALMFGPLEGAAVGLIGTLASQILRYGFMATTVFWLVPYVAAGYLVGLYAKKKSYRLTAVQTILTVVVGSLLVTAVNTPFIYLDALLYGKYVPGYILGPLPFRLLTAVVKGIIQGVVFPLLIRALRKIPLMQTEP